MTLTLSTKSWEGDYRQVLTADGLAALFDPLAPSAPRQVVLNRVADRADADARAQALVDQGLLARFAWAEDLWPEVAALLEVPVTWFGAAWPYSAPELCELFLAGSEHVLHVAGDVRVAAGEPWASRAVEALQRWPEVAVVAPLTPSRSELGEPEARALAPGWTGTQLFSDQCFLVRREQVLAAEVVRATHPIAGRYPRPGGALTFEARVGAWLRSTGRWRATDEGRDYRHPVSGAEGDSYVTAAAAPLLLPPLPCDVGGYPPAGSCDLLGVVVARDAERRVAHAVASLRWCREVLVLDGGSTDRTALRAAEVGATVRPGTPRDVASLGAPCVVLGADDLVTPRLAQVLVAAAEQRYGVEAPVRLLDRGRWRAAGSVRLLEGSPVRRTDLPLVRFGSTGLADAVARLNRESDERAQGAVLDRRAGGRVAVRAALRALRDRQGVRRAVHEGVAAWLWAEKAWEAAHGGPVQRQAEYDEVARALLEDRRP